MRILGPLTTCDQSFDGRRTLSNRGAILFVLLVVATFALVPVDRQLARVLGTLVFFLLVGGGVLLAGLTARDARKDRGSDG